MILCDKYLFIQMTVSSLDLNKVVDINSEEKLKLYFDCERTEKSGTSCSSSGMSF